MKTIFIVHTYFLEGLNEINTLSIYLRIQALFNGSNGSCCDATTMLHCNFLRSSNN